MEWQPIETAPKDAGAVLLWDGFSVFEGFNNYTCRDGMFYDNWCKADLSARPWTTHWMPLPAPPAQS